MTNDAMSFQLMIRQQPLQSRVCGVGEKVDRRPIDPPLIVQLDIIQPSSSRVEEQCMTQLFLTAVLVPDGKRFLDLSLHAQLTVGRTVSSLYHFKDLDGQEKNFFVFSDLSIRIEGSYRFQLCLFQIMGSSVSFQQSILTDEFTVYSAKKFPGMFGSCPLARCFADQGLKIRIRNQSGPRQHRRRHLTSSSITTEDDDSPPQQKKKKRKSHHHIDSSSSSTTSSTPSSPTIIKSPLPSISTFPQNRRLPSFSTFLQNMHPPPP
ncbi:velvet factor-domain-containing protein [Chlamydoabsidia padenii]|nr:velvet factor-domain-containing protein [Chlamydoabsidia padenii]